MGVMYYSAIVPCVIAAVVGDRISSLFGIAPTEFLLTGVPEGSALGVAKVALLGVLCAVLSILFCVCMHQSAALYKKLIPNKYLCAAVGGLLVALLTLLVGTRDYNGAGMDVIARAVAGQARPEAFALKILFTALTLGAGFKGGEIVPAFFYRGDVWKCDREAAGPFALLRGWAGAGGAFLRRDQLSGQLFNSERRAIWCEGLWLFCRGGRGEFYAFRLLWAL